MTPTLREKLNELATLERDHNLIGIRMQLRGNIEAHRGEFRGLLTTEENVDHALRIARRAIELGKERENLPLADEEYPFAEY